MPKGGTKCEHVAGYYGAYATTEELEANAAAEGAAKAAAEEEAKKAAAQNDDKKADAAAAAQQAAGLRKLEKGNYYRSGCIGMQY